MTDTIISTGGSGDGADDSIRSADQSNFVDEVITASNKQPVIVDFWAEWCEPCKQLTPVLERVVRQAGGKVRLVKVNVDENRPLAAQLRIQSLPTVMIFAGGRPVDAFSGVVPESQIRTLVKHLTGDHEPPPHERMIDQGVEQLEAGKPETALRLFQEALGLEPNSSAALGGLAKAYLELGMAEKARGILKDASGDEPDHPLLRSARAALELFEDDGGGADVSALEAKIAAAPDDLATRFDLAAALQKTGDFEAAADRLLEIIARDREWEDDRARQQLFKMFEAAGQNSDFTVRYRRKLSSILFS